MICWIESVDPVDDLCLTNQIYSALLNAFEFKEITEAQNAHLQIACSRLLESRAKERARGRKGGGLGREKGGKEEEPVIIFLNTSCRPLFSKCVNMSKCQNFSLSRILLLARVLEFARLSIRRFYVADTERFSALTFGIPSLKNL